MQTSREQEAMQAYLKVLKSQGLSQRMLIQREFIIQRLSVHLTGIAANGNQYRQAVEGFIRAIDAGEVSAVLPVIREFYSFWVRDIKGIVAMRQAKVFQGSISMPRASQDVLFKQWYELDKMTLLPHEQQALSLFHDAQLGNMHAPLLFKDRVRMAKYLILALRHVHHKQSLHYRQTVDAHLAFFNAMGTQALFLSVARDFYPCWRSEGSQSTSSKKEFAIAA